MRTPAGSVVTVTGDLVAACLTVTIDAPLVLPGTAATFKTAIDKQKFFYHLFSNSPFLH